MKKKPRTHSAPTRPFSETSDAAPPGDISVQPWGEPAFSLPEGMKTRPYGWPLMADAWKGCVAFAKDDPEIIRRFADETNWKPAQTPMEQMIDEATGRPEAIFAQFCDWVTVNIWGEEMNDAE